MRLLADENLNGAIVRGLLLREQRLDIVRVQDVGLSGASDPVVLEWAAQQGRVTLTHDARTMIRHAGDRTRAGLPMPGLLVILHDAPVRRAIEDILLIAEGSEPGEWEGRWEFLPLG